jgi:hypothetical protein
MNIWIRLLSGPFQGQTIPFALPVGGTILIGSAEDNHVILPAPVESHHLALANENGALLARSLGRTRTGGVSRSGQRIERAPLLSGDRLELGRGGATIEVLFQIEQPPPPPAPAPAPFAPPTAAPPRGGTAPQIAAMPAGSGFPAGTLPHLAAYPEAASSSPRATAPARAGFTEGAPVAAQPCGVCGGPLAGDSFICYQCRRTLCVAHYDGTAGVCSQCAAVSRATVAARSSFAPMTTAPAMPAASLTAPAIATPNFTAPAMPVPGLTAPAMPAANVTAPALPAVGRTVEMRQVPLPDDPSDPTRTARFPKPH